ncbi:MAG TPA: hypothetical protein VET87_18125 [Rubrivivax sp.]|jgi:hypothetical protein|nr:hypothetical protein [Rubrivivax sp.]
MQNKTLEKLIWSLIYAGLAILGFGIWFMEHSLAVGWTVLLSGGALILAGALGIWVRSRRP